MKTIGALLLVVGICLGIYALTMNTSVKVDYPMGNSFGLPDRVNNLGLMNDSQNYLIAAGILSVLGAVFYFMSKNSSNETEKFEYGFKQCPQCAEKVRSEAKICRFCNYDFANETNALSELKQWLSENPGRNINDYYSAKNNGKQNSFLAQMVNKTTEELNKIISEQRYDYQPEAIEAAELEMAKRNLEQA